MTPSKKKILNNQGCPQKGRLFSYIKCNPQVGQSKEFEQYSSKIEISNK